MRALFGLALLIATSGCAHWPSCQSDASSPLYRFECRAGSGDQLAQLELGRRYESGDGVPRDEKRAARLYRAAAQGYPGTIYVYSPPVGRHGRAMVLPVRTGVDRPGLAEAKYRLGRMYLEGRGVKVDQARGQKLIREAGR